MHRFRHTLLVLLLVFPGVGLLGCGDQPDSGPSEDLTVATLNILHGAFCPASTDGCRRPDRIDLLFQWIAASGDFPEAQSRIAEPSRRRREESNAVFGESLPAGLILVNERIASDP